MVEISKREKKIIKMIRDLKKSLDEIRGEEVVLCEWCSCRWSKKHVEEMKEMYSHPVSKRTVYKRAVTFDENGRGEINPKLGRFPEEL